MPAKMVTSFQEVIENISKYQDAVRQNEEIRKRVAMVWSWYAVKDKHSGGWKFAPSRLLKNSAAFANEG